MILQVRAKVDEEWNHWRSAPRKVITGETAEVRFPSALVFSWITRPTLTDPSKLLYCASTVHG